MRRLTFVALVAVLSILLSPGAGATHIDPIDPDDTSGPLDVARVVTWGDRWNPRWRITTYGRWTNRRIWDSGYLLVWLDTFGNDRFDYYVLVRSTGSRLQALLFQDRVYRRDLLIAYLNRWRPDDRSVAVVVPLSKVHFPETRTYYRWSVQTLNTSDTCRRVCMDFVPNVGAIREDVRLLAGIPI